jgi:uncharacterized protein
MRLDISSIIKLNGQSMDVEFSKKVKDLESTITDCEFEDVNFTGKLYNDKGTLRLDGFMRTKYKTRCYRCIKDVTRTMKIKVYEEFVKSVSFSNDDAYTYEDDFIDLEQVLLDNVVLHLPMKVICSENCMGLCPKCGCDLNNDNCQCTEEEINPQMEALKNFYKT